MLALGKVESCLDPAVPFGYPVATPVCGTTIVDHFRNKHRRGECGATLPTPPNLQVFTVIFLRRVFQ
jgi:hypothetical protein